MTAEDLAEQPLLGARRPTALSARRFRPLGLDLDWQGADAALTVAAARVLDSRAAATPTGLGLSILALRTQEPRPARDEAPAQVAPSGHDATPAKDEPHLSSPLAGTGSGLGAFTAAADGHAYREAGGLLAILTASGSCVLADLDAGRVTAFVSPQADLAAEAEALFGAPVWRFAAHQGLVACHAATVIAPSGRGLLLRAVGGGGKSTLALAAWQDGLGLLAEEVTWLDLRGEASGPTLRGRPDHLHIAPEMWRSLTAMETPAARSGIPPDSPAPTVAREALAPVSAGGGKVRVSLAHPPERLYGSAPAGPVVFLARDEAPEAGAWRWASPDEAHDRWRAAAIPGEASQRGMGLAGAERALLARGAYVLGADTPRQMARRLREIDEDWGRSG